MEEIKESAVARFIQNFTKGDDIITNRFRAGYCWHFAHLLRDTFRRGQVCLAAPFSHFVWIDDDGRKWDIEGEYAYSEAYYYIPEEEIPEEELITFRHIPGETSEGIRKEGAIALMRRHCLTHGLSYDKSVEDFLR